MGAVGTFLASLVAHTIALPLHFPFGYDTLCPIYLVLAVLLAGTVISYRAMRAVMILASGKT